MNKRKTGILALLFLLIVSGCGSREKEVVCNINDASVYTMTYEEDTLKIVQIKTKAKFTEDNKDLLLPSFKTMKESYNSLNGITFDFKESKDALTSTIEVNMSLAEPIYLIGYQILPGENESELNLKDIQKNLEAKGYTCN